MIPVVRRLKLKGFRSFDQADLKLANPTFLVGRNGAGKSNLLDAFNFLSECMRTPLSAVLDARGGIQNVRYRTPGRGQPRKFGLSIELQPIGQDLRYRYAFELYAESVYGYRVSREECILDRLTPGRINISRRAAYFDRREEDIKTSVEGLAVKPEPTALILPLAGGLELFAPLVTALSRMRIYGFSPGTLRAFQDPDAGLLLNTDASNAASVLQDIANRSPEDLERISELVQAAVPHTKVTKPIKHGTKLSMGFLQEWERKSIRFEAYNMSDGTLRILGLLLTVFQSQVPNLLGIEEPETSLHPGAVGVLLDVLKTASDRSHLIVSTQSPEVLDSELVSEENLRIVEWSEGTSRVVNIAKPAREALRNHLMGAGGLLRANELQPGVDPGRSVKLFVDP